MLMFLGGIPILGFIMTYVPSRSELRFLSLVRGIDFLNIEFENYK